MYDGIMGWWDDGIMGWWDDGMMGWWDDGMMGWWDVVWGVKLRKNCEVYVLCGRYLPDPYPIYSPNNHRWKRHAARWPHSQMVLSGHRRPDITLKREQNGSRNQEPQQKKLAQIDIFVPIKQNSFAKDTSCTKRAAVLAVANTICAKFTMDASSLARLGFLNLFWIHQSPPGTPRPTIYKWLFQLDDSHIHIGNGCFTKHPFRNGCLGFQAVIPVTKWDSFRDDELWNVCLLFC